MLVFVVVVVRKVLLNVRVNASIFESVEGKEVELNGKPSQVKLKLKPNSVGT